MRGPPGQAARRTAVPAVVFVSACLLCLGTGFYTGKLYAENPSAASYVPVLTTGGSPAASSQQLSAPGKAIYAPGTTRYLGLQGAEGRKPVCTNTCKKARDGVCDDGRVKPGPNFAAGTQRAVFCDLGTDCDDCGPWQPSGDVPWATGSSPGPVERLRKKGVDVFVRKTITSPEFEFAYTDPTKDFDVSHHMAHGGGVELGITRVFYKIFKQSCMPQGPNGKRGLFLDVGSNFGWFAVQAASLGCRVIAFEPVPHFHAFLEYSVHLNGFAHLVDMRGNVISHETGKTMEMFVPSRGIWGTAGIGGLNIDRAIANNTNEVLHIQSQSVDELVDQEVLLMKVDVEGWEWSVFQGAKNLITKRLVKNVIMEYSPGVPERHFKFKEMAATVQMLVNLVDHGHRIAHLGDQNKHVSGPWDQPLPSYEEVTRHNLMYDLVDVALFAQQKLGCPMAPPMLKFQSWQICNCLPEDVSPRGLRSLIGHNTNLWASLDHGLLPLKGVVGIMKPDAPPNLWFVEPGQVFGSGSRPCRQLDAKVQVRHRCPCTDKGVCEAEEKAAQEAATQGLIASSYTLTPDGKQISASGNVAELLTKIGSAAVIGDPYKLGAVKGPLSEVNKPLG